MNWTKLQSTLVDQLRSWRHVILSAIMIQCLIQLFIISYHYQERDSSILTFSVQCIFLLVALYGAIKVANRGEPAQPQTLSKLSKVAKWIIIVSWISTPLFLLMILMKESHLIFVNIERFFSPIITVLCFIMVGLYRDNLLAALLILLAESLILFQFFILWAIYILEVRDVPKSSTILAYFLQLSQPLSHALSALFPYMSVHVLGVLRFLSILYYTIALYRAQPKQTGPETEASVAYNTYSSQVTSE